MPTDRPRNTKPPAYRRRKGASQALVTLQDSVTKQRRDYRLGEHGSLASRQRYHRLIAEWEGRGRRWPDPTLVSKPTSPLSQPTTGEVLDEYWHWALTCYSPSHLAVLRPVVRLLRRFYGTTPARDFGPRKLRLPGDEMIRGDVATRQRIDLSGTGGVNPAA